MYLRHSAKGCLVLKARGKLGQNTRGLCQVVVWLMTGLLADEDFVSFQRLIL